MWYEWEQNLQDNGIQFCVVSFHPDDICGTASHDANELSQIVQSVKSMTLQNQVNIVAHSKGGLDAREYLYRSDTHDVANLIMIGTPNEGSPLADATVLYNSDPSCPAVHDLTTYASDINVPENVNTNYYTIAGECLPFLYYAPLGVTIPEPNDGFVAVSSAQSHFNSLGVYPNCHMQLLGDYEYGLAYGVLSGSRYNIYVIGKKNK